MRAHVLLVLFCVSTAGAVAWFTSATAPAELRYWEKVADEVYRSRAVP